MVSKNPIIPFYSNYLMGDKLEDGWPNGKIDFTISRPTKIKITQPQTPDQIQGRDLFQTPNYAIDLLIPYIPNYIKLIWEPASGDGKITKRLINRSNGSWIGWTQNIDNIGYNLYTSDINEDSLGRNMLINFLTEKPNFKFHSIITNPPFSLKRKFYEKCLEYDVPFALLIPLDFNGWLCKAFDEDNCQALIPNRRINYITPTGKQGKQSSSQFHSFWLTRGFNLPKQMNFVNLSLEEMKNNI